MEAARPHPAGPQRNYRGCADLRNQTVEMPFHLNLALDNGVTPAELSEIITHLAFYSGWANAMSAVAVAKDVFAKRGVRP